mmetsp:Transcript_33386/g.78262  ORF Transcript_33386/g.78262 Transcript_33386/m.78262 type:complete len:88 (-) Transcript_33386:119-382(-)
MTILMISDTGWPLESRPSARRFKEKAHCEGFNKGGENVGIIDVEMSEEEANWGPTLSLGANSSEVRSSGPASASTGEEQGKLKTQKH